MLNGELVFLNIDTVTNIVWMLDKEEDARTKNFLTGRGEDERKREKRRSRSSQGGNKAGTKEGNLNKLAL